MKRIREKIVLSVLVLALFGLAFFQRPRQALALDLRTIGNFIGIPVGGGTALSVLFIDALGKLGNDPSNLSYSTTTVTLSGNIYSFNTGSLLGPHAGSIASLTVGNATQLSTALIDLLDFTSNAVGTIGQWNGTNSTTTPKGIWLYSYLNANARTFTGPPDFLFDTVNNIGTFSCSTVTATNQINASTITLNGNTIKATNGPWTFTIPNVGKSDTLITNGSSPTVTGKWTFQNPVQTFNADPSNAAIVIVGTTTSGSGSKYMGIGYDQNQNVGYLQAEFQGTSYQPIYINPLGGGVLLNAYSRTIAQLNSTTPLNAGELYYCSNCATDAIVVSTSTAKGAFARINARSTVIN